MARNVTDAAVLLGAGIGVDPNDAATAAQAGHAFTDYTRFLDADALDGARIGVWHSYDDAGDAATIEIFKATVDKLESLGATVVDPLEIDFGDGFAREFEALLCEFKTDIASYLEHIHRRGLPEDAPGPDRLRQRSPGARGALEQLRLRPGRGDRRPGRSRLRRRPRGHDAGDPGGDRCRVGRQRPRRHRRPDEQPGLGDRPGQRRLASRGSSRRRALRPSAAMPASPSRTGSSGRCRSACRSSADAGPSRRSSASPTRSSRRPRCASRRSSCRRRTSMQRARHASGRTMGIGARSRAAGGPWRPSARTTRPLIHRGPGHSIRASSSVREMVGDTGFEPVTSRM